MACGATPVARNIELARYRRVPSGSGGLTISEITDLRFQKDGNIRILPSVYLGTGDEWRSIRKCNRVAGGSLSAWRGTSGADRGVQELFPVCMTQRLAQALLSRLPVGNDALEFPPAR